MKAIIVTLFLFFVAGSSFSQTREYTKGMEDFASGDYKNALKHLKPYADQGDANAQFIVGSCYFSDDLGIRNIDTFEYYLLQASQQKSGAAMGLLAVLYFEKSASDPVYKVDALAWAEIAAAYDLVQKGTSTRYVIRQYLTQEELKKVADLLQEKKKTFDKIDLTAFSSSVKKESVAIKRQIPENKTGLITDFYLDWVYRWKYEKFECDTLYYTADIDDWIIDSTVNVLNKTDLFSNDSQTLELTKEERAYLIDELNKLKLYEWQTGLFPFSRRIERTEIEAKLAITERLKTENARYMCSIIYTFSKPIYLRNGTLCLFLDQKIYRTNYTQLNFSFYFLENGTWKKFDSVYSYLEREE